MSAPYKISPSDRLFCCGATGSGKSHLMRRLLAPVKRAIVLDPKGEIVADRWRCIPASSAIERELEQGNPARVLYQPGPRDSEDFWSSAVERAYETGDCTIYVDEMYLIVPPGQRTPQPIIAAITTGRSRGIGVWCVTQRPVWVTLFAKSEATHYFCFRLMLDEDRRNVAAFMGEEILKPIRDEHGYYYYSPARGLAGAQYISQEEE